ncbi:hypothetical protein PHAVU_001G134766 [Phaseolus vulgaris]
MIVFSSKEYNIDRLVQSARKVLLERKVDPYLELIEDYNKLQVVNFAPDNLNIMYGSKEDDDRATQTLSELLGYINETREIFASEIIKCLENFAKAELSSIKEQLLEEFAPDAMCELGSQLKMNMATMAFETPNPAGRISVCNAYNMPYNDMADKCEVLLMEKQKMSRLMSAQQKQDNLVDSLLLNQDNEMKNMDVSNQVDFQKVGIPPFDDNVCVDLYQPTSGPLPVFANEYENHPFKLPVASPYDNFLKAAGC